MRVLERHSYEDWMNDMANAQGGWELKPPEPEEDDARWRAWCREVK